MSVRVHYILCDKIINMLPAYKSHGLNTIARVNDGLSTGAVRSAAVPLASADIYSSK